MGNTDNCPLNIRRRRDERGQAAVEYLMIIGLLASIIIATTRIIVPIMSLMVVSLMRLVAVYLTSVPA
jgi:Flp pilus assembly pilin Flp